MGAMSDHKKAATAGTGTASKTALYEPHDTPKPDRKSVV